MMPHLMNCSHDGDGWCLSCVGKLHDENEYLLWFRQNCDFGPAHEDVVEELDSRYKREQDKNLPPGWE